MMEPLAWTLGFLVLVAAVVVPPLRRAYWDGWRCLARHPILWKLPALFAGAYGLFGLLSSALLQWRISHVLFAKLVAYHPLQPGDWSMLVGRGMLPVGEQLTAMLNCLVSVFPLSALAALLFFVNYRGLTRQLRRALLRRFGALSGWLLFIALACCALAATLKPLFLLALPELSERLGGPLLLPIATLLNALAFIFEYLLGTVFQVYLVLTAYGWIRGLQFEEKKLLPFAVRRLGIVVKWSLVIIAATVLLLHVPLLVWAFHPASPPWGAYIWPRTILVCLMLVLGTVQIRLILHNDSLKEALAANRRFLATHGVLYGLFLFTSGGFLLTLKALTLAVPQSLGDSLLGHVCSALGQIIVAGAGGWILAAWVCFYKSRESGQEVVY